MQEGASGERARGDRVRPAEPPPRVPLPSLRAMGWALQRGASTLLTTPVGSILLPASQSGKEAALSLDQCCLERWENVLRIGPVTVPMWWLVLTASGLMFVAFFQFYLSFALGLAYRSWEYRRPAALVLPTAFVTSPAIEQVRAAGLLHSHDLRVGRRRPHLPRPSLESRPLSSRLRPHAA